MKKIFMINEQNLDAFSKLEVRQSPPKYNSISVYLTVLAGITFIVFLFAGLFQLPEPPSAIGRDENNQLLWYLIENRQTLLFQTYLRTAAAFLMFLFIGGAVSIAYRKIKELKAAGIFALGGALLFTALMFISQVTDATAALMADETINPAIIRAVAAIGDTMRHFNAFSAALMMGSVTIYLRQARLVPIWQTVFGLISIPLFLVAAAGFPNTPNEYLNLIALPYLPLFPLTLSIALLIGRRKNVDENKFKKEF